MAKNRRNKRNREGSNNSSIHPKSALPISTSLLDNMKDGREFESLLSLNDPVKIDVAGDIRKSLAEISAIRGRPIVCYLANVVNQSIKQSTSINADDDLPFNELISCVGDSEELDIVLVTPGGSGQQVAKFVEKIRNNFKNVTFIIPNIAMSAGTIFVMSGDEIIMTPNSYIGPIDPQIPDKNGFYVPAQAVLSLIADIQNRGEDLLKKGQNPPWTDLQILKQIDGKEIGNAINASKYSIELVTDYLRDYKFKTWEKHETSGAVVTENEKEKRANEIASKLCDHGKWKTHSRGITREIAWSECRLKITHSESIDGLDRAIRRFWALTYWCFENTGIYKMFISSDYCLLRIDNTLGSSKGK